MTTIVKDITLWRAEHRSGVGMYTKRSIAKASAWAIAVGYNVNDRHPLPEDDPILCEQWFHAPERYDMLSWVFAFRTLQQTRKWIYQRAWRQRLAKTGVVLNKYIISSAHCIVGADQAVFDKSQATLVETRSIARL